MTDSQYATLRDAVRAYDRALKAYGLLGAAWVDHSDELDRLWTAVLRAAGLPTYESPDSLSSEDTN